MTSIGELKFVIFGAPSSGSCGVSEGTLYISHSSSLRCFIRSLRHTPEDVTICFSIFCTDDKYQQYQSARASDCWYDYTLRRNAAGCRAIHQRMVIRRGLRRIQTVTLKAPYLRVASTSVAVEYTRVPDRARRAVDASTRLWF